MPNLSQSELNAIREVVTAHQVSSKKLCDYANLCQDEQVKQMFSKGSQDAMKNANDLINMIK